MLAPCSAKLRATSSSSRGRSNESTAIWTRKLAVEAAVPLHRREPLRVPHQRLHIRAVLAVDRDPAAERDVAEDPVPGHRRAALRHPNEHVVDPLHLDPQAVAGDGRAQLRRLQRDDRLLGDLFRLQPLQDLVDDLVRLELVRAERDVEVSALREAGFANHLSQDRGALQLLVRQVLSLQRVVEQLAPLGLGLAPRLTLEPLPDLVPGARGRGEAHPVARRAAARLRGEDLDEVAVLKPVVERDDAAVDLRADRPCGRRRCGRRRRSRSASRPAAASSPHPSA